MACSSGCPTPGLHATFGQCLRAKNLQVADPAAFKYNTGISHQLDGYRAAREAGLQPATVFRKDVESAWRETDRTGTPFRADEVA